MLAQFKKALVPCNDRLSFTSHGALKHPVVGLVIEHANAQTWLDADGQRVEIQGNSGQLFSVTFEFPGEHGE